MPPSYCIGSLPVLNGRNFTRRKMCSIYLATHVITNTQIMHVHVRVMRAWMNSSTLERMRNWPQKHGSCSEDQSVTHAPAVVQKILFVKSLGNPLQKQPDQSHINPMVTTEWCLAAFRLVIL